MTGTWIAPSLFHEPEYRTAFDLTVAVWLMVNTDMLGVAPVVSRSNAAACRLSKRKFEGILE